MIRAILSSVMQGVVKRFSATGRPGEAFSNREYLQHYGFTSMPLPGAEGVVIEEGNMVIMVATDDRRYRIAIASGEVALYTDEGDHIHLKRGRLVEIETETLLVKASTKVRFETPLVETTGRIEAEGTIKDLSTTTGKTMNSMRDAFNPHHHSGIQPGPGNSAGPDQEM